MLGKDKKVFVLSLVTSSFALATALKAQNYSYESYQPYVTSGVNHSARVEVMPLPTSSAPDDLIDLSSIYANGVSVSYTNDNYPINDVSTKRKVMRMASVPNYFRDGSSSGDWTIRIGEEEVMPMGFVSEDDIKPASLNQARREQYGNLMMDEIAVGNAEFNGDVVVSSDEFYTYPEMAVVEDADVSVAVSDVNKYEDVKQLSARIKEKRSYPWVESHAYKGPVSSVALAEDVYADAYRSQRVVNPWSGSNQAAFESGAKPTVRSVKPRTSYNAALAKTVKIERRNELQQRQQARLIPELSKPVSNYRTFQKISADGFVPEYSEDVSVFEGFADGAATTRVEDRVEENVVSKKQEAPVVKRPLLVPIDEVKETVEIDAVNSGVVAEYKVDVVPVKPIQPIKTQMNADANISLTELKINFKPFKSDLSVKTVKWLKEFSKIAANDFENVIEIKMSPHMPYVQNERLLMLKGILNSNGVYDQQIRVVANRKNVDSVVIKILGHEDDDDEVAEVVDYQDMNGSYYYYY